MKSRETLLRVARRVAQEYHNAQKDSATHDAGLILYGAAEALLWAVGEPPLEKPDIQAEWFDVLAQEAAAEDN